MNAALTRRVLVATAAGLTAARGAPACEAIPDAVAAIERSRGGRLGVFALDTAMGRTLEYRADERFLLQSTFKGILAAMVLSRIDAGQDHLAQQVTYGAQDLLPASPVTTAHVTEGGLSV